MALFGLCYISVDGLGVTASRDVQAEDLADALIAARVNPARPARGTYSTLEIWHAGERVFCGDPDKPDHRDAPDERCVVAA